MATSALTGTRYSPENPPKPDDPDFQKNLVEYLKREYGRIADALKGANVFNFEEQFVLLDKPQEGDTLYADGTSWNPGLGIGLYSYINGVWRLLSGDQTLLVGSRKGTLFTANGTFTPDSKMLECDVWASGGGGQGGGAAATAAGQLTAGGGGHGGSLAYDRFTKTTIGASQAVTIGAGGTGAGAGAAGNAGAATTLGALLSAGGGPGGAAMGAGAVGQISAFNAVTQSATGLYKGWSSMGTPGITAAVITQGGNGGSNWGGGAGIGARTASGGAGGAGGGAAQANSGGGGGGATSTIGGAAGTGGNGGSGWMLVIEYLKLA